MKTALFVGRFQPIHNAHLSVIKKILSEEYNLIVGIGRAQESRTSLNPFTGEERKEMVRGVLGVEGIECKVILIPDKKENEDWMEHVSNICPEFDVVFTGNPKTKKCFYNSEYEIKDIELVDNISSNLIRQKIIKGEEIKSLIHPFVYNYIEEFGISRLKKIIQK